LPSPSRKLEFSPVIQIVTKKDSTARIQIRHAILKLQSDFLLNKS
jgi:hypothetical protein